MSVESPKSKVSPEKSIYFDLNSFMITNKDVFVPYLDVPFRPKKAMKRAVKNFFLPFSSGKSEIVPNELKRFFKGTKTSNAHEQKT
jgi:hypothetical protein